MFMPNDDSRLMSSDLIKGSENCVFLNKIRLFGQLRKIFSQSMSMLSLLQAEFEKKGYVIVDFIWILKTSKCDESIFECG